MERRSSSGPVKIRRALISVSDKTGLEKLVKVLDRLGVEIISTGRTREMISSWGVRAIGIEDFTGSPEIMDGRVKTLHPKVHGAILARRDDAAHMEQLAELGSAPIDMVVVNLYPFEHVSARRDVSPEEVIENIDIGGPTLLRSAAKNFDHVAALSDTDQYDKVIEELERTVGSVGAELRKSLAQAVFERTAGYDSSISAYFASGQEEDKDTFPDQIDIRLEKRRELRYGENPHQKAAFYVRDSRGVPGLADAEQLNGKELSFNNIADIAASVEIVKPFDMPATAVVKHTNPSGVACADDLRKAFLDALDCDRMSAFGGIMAFNRPVDGRLAETVLEESGFIECVVAPDFTAGAVEVFQKKKNLRVIKLPEAAFDVRGGKDIKFIPGGALIQELDIATLEKEALKSMTGKAFPEELLPCALFGWKVVKNVRSNAIVLVKGLKTVGIGAGQMSRVDAVELAIRKAAGKAEGSVLVSDAFFPKADSVQLAGKAGIVGIVQPGGSIRDDEVVEACREHGIPMAATGMRCFKH